MAPPLNFVLKVVSQCNLNCSYCYVYNKGDETWRQRPRVMPDMVFRAAVSRIRQHCVRSGQATVLLTFHGGEPCLVGPSRFSAWCTAAQEALGDVAQVSFVMQTNGTLLDPRWTEVLLAHRVQVGVSIDGPKEIHDIFRVNHRGKGSYDAVARGVACLRRANIPLQILSVIQLGNDGLRIHRHFLEMGAKSINYLFPDFTHDTIGCIREIYGATPCADYLIPILENWWSEGSMDVRIGIFWHMSQLILGGESRIDALGNRPFRFVFIEANGDIEGLDVLRVCQEGMASTGLNVLRNDFTDIAGVSKLHRLAIFDGVPLPTGCRTCPERMTCSGGWLPHRYSRAGGFDNPTIWCEDMLRLFGRLRELLHVPVEETALRRRLLAEVTHRDALVTSDLTNGASLGG
jgi:uncharacterized protein